MLALGTSTTFSNVFQLSAVQEALHNYTIQKPNILPQFDSPPNNAQCNLNNLNNNSNFIDLTQEVLDECTEDKFTISQLHLIYKLQEQDRQQEQQQQLRLQQDFILNEERKKSNNTQRKELSKIWPLFYFLQASLNSNNNNFQCPVSSSHSLYSLLNFIQVINEAYPTSHFSLCFALIYANSVLMKFSSNNSKPFCHHCLLSTCMLLSAKYLDDFSVNLTTWAQVCDMPAKYMLKLERSILKALDYDLYVDFDLFNEFSASYECDPLVEAMRKSDLERQQQLEQQQLEQQQLELQLQQQLEQQQLRLQVEELQMNQQYQQQISNSHGHCFSKIANCAQWPKQLSLLI